MMMMMMCSYPYKCDQVTELQAFWWDWIKLGVLGRKSLTLWTSSVILYIKINIINTLDDVESLQS